MATTAPASLGTTTPAIGTTSATPGLGNEVGMGGYGAGTYGKVILTLKSAHELRDKTWIGKADPYCVVKVADAEIQTQYVKNAGDHVVWEESFAFNNVAPDDVVEFNVYDKNRLLKDNMMGTGSLSMRQVFTEGRLETRVPLTSSTGTKEAGEIWVTLRTEDGGLGMGATEGVGMGTTGLETGLAGAHISERKSSSGTSTTSGHATTGATTGAVQTGREAVCGQEYFTKIEDRPVVKERVTVLREHRPVEREYVVETRATGVEQQKATETEHLGAQDKVVSVAPPAPAEHNEEYFTKTEDRPVVKERTHLMKEHRPVEKEFVVETRATGAEQALGTEQEHLGAQEQVVSVAPPAPAEHNEEYFTKTEDRPVVKERTHMMKEHHPVEREYVVETRATGVEKEEGRMEEHLGEKTRIVSEAAPSNPCE